jgi:hypothetical protein
MTWLSDIDNKYLDRRGCGDELYLDSRFKSALIFAELNGTTPTSGNLALDEEEFDDTSHH